VKPFCGIQCVQIEEAQNIRDEKQLLQAHESAKNTSKARVSRFLAVGNIVVWLQGVWEKTAKLMFEAKDGP